MQQPKAVMVRFADRRVAEAAEIMASIFGQSLNEYIQEAVQARIEQDVPENLAAYEAVRTARDTKAQEKGA